MKLIYIFSLFPSTFGYTIRGAPELLKNGQGLAVLDAKQLPTRRHLQDKEVYEEEIISLVDLAAKNSSPDDQLASAIDSKDNTPDTVLEDEDEEDEEEEEDEDASEEEVTDDMNIGEDEGTIEDEVTTPELPENDEYTNDVIVDNIFDTIQGDAYDMLTDIFDELVIEIDKAIEHANPGLAGKRLGEAREDLLYALLDWYNDEEGEPNKDQELNIEELDELDDEDDSGSESEDEDFGEDEDSESESEDEDFGDDEDSESEWEWEWRGEDFGEEGVDVEDSTELEGTSGEFEDFMTSIRGN